MTLTVADILTRSLITVSPETMLGEAARLMSENRISCLIAVAEKKPVGILTESDLVHVCRLGVDAESSVVSDFMANPVISTLTNMNIFEVYDFLLEKNMRHLVVVNQDDELEGLVTLSDILKATAFDDYLHAKLIRDVMRSPIVTVPADQSVHVALENMDSIHISCVVVTEKEKAIGIFTERDAARLLAAKQHAKQLRMSEVMTSPLLTLEPDDPLILASTTMREVGTRRLVIVDSSDQPIGIVTQFDVVRGLEGVSIRHFKELYAKSEQKLEENNKLLEEKSELERIVAASPGVLYRSVWDNSQAQGEFHPTYFSPQIRSMLGYEPSDLLRPDWWKKYVHPDDLTLVQECLQNLVISGERDSTYRLKTKSNDYIWVLDHARVNRDADGKPVEMVGSWLDISERKQAEQEIYESEEKFRSLFDEARDMMHIVGIDGRILDVNQIELDTLGYSRDEMIGKPVRDIICLEFLEETYSRIKRVLNGDLVPVAELALRKKDGGCIPVEITASPQFNKQGNVVAGRAVIRDIRDRKRKEVLLVRREQQLSVLAEAGRVINEQLDEIGIGRSLVNLACRLVDCDSGGFGFYHNEKVCFREYLKSGKRMSVELDFPAGYGVPGFVLETKAPYISADATSDANVIPEIQQSLGFIKLIDVPILDAQGEYLGCFEMHDRIDGADFDEQDLEMLQSLAGIVAVSMINVRQQTEIKHEATRMQLILDAEFDAVVVQQDEKVVFSNKNAQILFGYDSLEETLGENAMLAFLPEQRSFACRVVRRAIRRNEPTGRIEMMGISRARPEPFPMEIASVPIDWAGKPAVVSVVRDITERQLAEKQLESERAAMRAILNNLPFMAWLKDDESRFIAVNDNFAKACGASDAESLVGKNDFDIWPEELAIAYRLDDQDVMVDSGKAKQVEEQVEIEGDKRWFETFKSPVFDATGKVVGTAGMARDITEKINNEAQMRLLENAVSAVNESIIITDSEGVIEYVNPGFTLNTGFTNEDAIGNTPAMLNSKQQAKGFYEQFWQTIKSGKPWAGRILDRKKDGTIFPVHLSVAPIFNDHGQISHFVAVHEDLSEVEMLQKKMMESQKMEAVATMVGGVAHDFNNLLASIVGNLYLMRNQHKDNQKTVSRIRGMESSVQHGAQLIQQMLTFARKDRTEMHVLDLKAFVKEAFKLAHASIPENIDFKLDYPSNKNFWIRGDATQLQQVLLNLVTNALHAVKGSEKPAIKVAFDYVAPGLLLLARHAEMTNESGWCCLCCSDNGCGMTADLIERIFEPFYTTKAVGEGTGLGLAMVYGAVQNHKGIIDVQSAPGEGTRVSIYLPLHKAKGTRVVELDDAEVDAQGLTVLLVDDEEGLRQVLADVLRHNGFSVLQASDGEHAVEMFERHEADISLVLMDVVMPNKGGVVAAKEIREINATVPIIFQTGYGEQTQLEAAAAITNSDSLQKPVQIPVLMKLILSKIHG